MTLCHSLLFVSLNLNLKDEILITLCIDLDITQTFYTYNRARDIDGGCDSNLLIFLHAVPIVIGL